MPSWLDLWKMVFIIWMGVIPVMVTMSLCLSTSSETPKKNDKKEKEE